jgi:hypothetical protein
MVDKAAIFTGLTKRNALRKEAGLPPLDIRAEMNHEVALAKFREVHAIASEHEDDRLMIQEQVTWDLRATHGQDFGRTMGGRWAIAYETEKRFRAHLQAVYGIETPPLPVKNAIVYGEGASAVVVEIDADDDDKAPA